MNNDCLNTPEARTLQMAICEGSVTPMSMLNQFVNGSNLGLVERDVLINYLKIMQQKGHLPTKMNPQIQQYLKIPPVVVPPPPPPHGPLVGPPTLPQQQQAPPPLSPARGSASPRGPPDSLNLSIMKDKPGQRLSPSMFGSGGVPANGGNKQLSVQATSPVQQRIPSPQELTIHAQQIMQNALIKRKLEEQKENYRKRNENNGGGDRSNSVGRSVASPAPLAQAAPTNFAFTPLSVMKKQAAERRDSDPKPQIPELRINQQSEGEAAVAGILAPQLQQQHRVSPLQQQQQQQQQPVPLPHPHLLMQQQQQQQHHQIPFQNAHRAGGSGRFLPRHNPSGGGGPPQMIPPHQPQQGGGFMGGPLGALAGANGGGGGGGLSRFFSPEVLAQAHSGNAPTMPPLPTQKVLTLEEIERQAAAVRM